MHFRDGHRHWGALVITVLAATTALQPLCAFGQTVQRTDPAHDVLQLTSSGKPVAAPANEKADIVHATLRHTHRRVVTRMKLRGFGGMWEYLEYIKTPTTEYQVVGTPQDFFLIKAFTRDSPVSCRALSAMIHPATHTIRVSIPRSCLHRPRWVRISLGYFWSSRSGAQFVDDSLRRGGAGAGWGLTARLYPG